MLSQITEEELTRLKWEGASMPLSTAGKRRHRHGAMVETRDSVPCVCAGEAVTFLTALRGPQAVKAGDRLRVWWEPRKCYDGVVIEVWFPSDAATRVRQRYLDFPPPRMLAGASSHGSRLSANDSIPCGVRRWRCMPAFHW